MLATDGIINHMQHHDQLNLLSLSYKDDVHVPEELYQRLYSPHHAVAYELLFIESGTTSYQVDFENKRVSNGQLLFIVPHQVTVPPSRSDIDGAHWYKVLFDEHCLSLLSRSHPFLRNPFSKAVVTFDDITQDRLISLFDHIGQILEKNNGKGQGTILLSYLTTLLAEINHQYFHEEDNHSLQDQHVQTYISFREYIEEHYRDQPSIATIASELAISRSRLHDIVTQYAGKSPKQYLNDRIILEAKRRLFYEEVLAKELAYDLGFNDHQYFSRFFKKQTGQSITQYQDEVGDLSN